jgi:hypothetical protein
LERFWNRFIANWDVLLHGNPAVDVYNGLKLAAGGELGIGVGEEEWGSGEREVLEDFAGRTDGLVDLVVSRFGEPSAAQSAQSKKAGTGKAKSESDKLEPWMGAGRHAEAPDGVVFSGIGNISRSSVRAISNWMQWIYAYGDYAYGVKDNPSSDRRKRKRNPQRTKNGDTSQHSNGKPDLKKEESKVSRHDQLMTETSQPTQSTQAHLPGIPPPIVSTIERSLERATSAVDVKQKAENNETERSQSSLGATEKWMKYLTLGYGSSWGPTSNKTEEIKRENADKDERDTLGATVEEASLQQLEPEPDIDHFENLLKVQIQQEDNGYFIVGLKGSLEDDPDEEDVPTDRILLRTLYVDLLSKSHCSTAVRTSYKPSTSEAEENNNSGDDDTSTLDPTKPDSKTTRLRVIIYVHRPFIYTFLFHPHTESLTYASFYRNLHTYLSPLHRPFSASTSPSKVAARIAAASNTFTTTTTTPSSFSSNPSTEEPQILALIFDPSTLALHASLPNIPIPAQLSTKSHSSATTSLYPQGWSRAEALNVHSSVLDLYASGRGGGEKERSIKTGRGWWVVWVRIGSEGEGAWCDEIKESFEGRYKEAVLVRRARDAVSVLGERFGGKKTASRFLSFGLGAGGNTSLDVSSGWETKGLAEGVGVDTRRYVEGLLSLSR